MHALLLLLAVSTPAPAGTRALTYADALRDTLAANPTLLATQAATDAAEGALVSSKGTFDPMLELDAGGSYYHTRSRAAEQEGDFLSWSASLSRFFSTGTTATLDWENNQASDWTKMRYSAQGQEFDFETEEEYYDTRVTLTVSQSLLQGFGTAWNLQAVRAAERSLDQAEAAEMEARLQAVAEAATAYWTLRYLQEMEEIARQALAVAQEEERVVVALVDQGKLAPMERSRVAAAVIQARTTLLEAENSRRQGADTLAVLIGARPDGSLEAISQPDVPPRLDLDADRVVEAALAGNPTLRARNVDVDGARDALAQARKARRPELTAWGYASTGGHDKTEEADTATWSDAMAEMFELDLPEWYLGGTLTVPLGNRADRGAALQAAGTLTGAEQTLRLAALTLEQQVRAQVRAVEASLQRVDLAEANLRYSQSTLDAEKALQREGRAIQKDVLEAQRLFAAAQGEVARARIDYAVAIVELGRLQGRIEGVGR